MLQKTIFSVLFITFCVYLCDSAKINTPRVLLPWFENLHVNFTFEINEGGCYTWSLSRDDIIDLEPIYEDSWGHCSRAARVSVSKTCAPPGSVIILAEEVNSGEILRGDVDIDKISHLEVMSTTWKLYLEEAPEAFEVVAYDDQGNTFTTLEGVTFTWNVENLGDNLDEAPLVTFVRWRDTDYVPPRGVAELEAKGLKSHSLLLYGQAMGECRVNVCLNSKICTDFNLHVVASVVLTPASASIALGDTLRYRVVRARAGRLTIQDISETLYYIKIPDTNTALLEDTVSLVRGTDLGATNVLLMSGSTEVASAVLTVTQPHSIRVSLRPANLVVTGEKFVIHCIVLDSEGHILISGDELLIRLQVDGEASVDLVKSTENGTLTDAVAMNAGAFTVIARLYSVAGKVLINKVEGKASAVAVDPLQVVPPELYVAWTGDIQEFPLKHRGGGNEAVVWSEVEGARQKMLSVSKAGQLTVNGEGSTGATVQLAKYSYVKAHGRILSAAPELVQVSSTGQARVGRLHQLHIALTATHPETGEYYNFHVCNCASFAVSLIEGPEPQNVTAAPWVQPVEGACCVIECAWASRGVSHVRASRGRTGAAARVAVTAPPALLWPQRAAGLPSAHLPVLALGESLVPQSLDPRLVELVERDGQLPYKHPDAQLFTMKCRRKGETQLELTSYTEEEKESVQFDVACVSQVSRIRLEPSETPNNCSGGPKIWLRPGKEVSLKVTLLDSIGRELLDERGPKMSWHIEPTHHGIEFQAQDRLFMEIHPEYAPVPVPYKYYQLVVADDTSVGWNGVLKTSIPDANAAIPARVVAPLAVEPSKIRIAWEGDSLSNIAKITGGSGTFVIEGPKGVTSYASDGSLNAIVPGPGSYDLVVYDSCVQGERVEVEVTVEEILTLEISTARAVCVGHCVPISVLVKGVSHQYLSSGGEAKFQVSGGLQVRGGQMCGTKEGAGYVAASLAGVQSDKLQILVFPPLQIIPSLARVAPGAKLQLRHVGGPPSHLAAFTYISTKAEPSNCMQVAPTGLVHGQSTGKGHVKLVATDISNLEMASAEASIEVVPISGLRVKAATQTLLVGSPSPIWIEAEGLTAASLSAVHPKVTWTVRDPTSARLYTTHVDDLLERSVAEGLSVRVVPMKPGIVTIDVRVRNMGQVSETRTWDSTIEILGISEMRASVEGLPKEFTTNDRIALAVGSIIQMKSIPRAVWKGYDDGSFEISPGGQLKALKSGSGVALAQNKDERNNIYRETAIHIEVSIPHYCTVEPAGDLDENAVRVVMRNAIGRELLAPEANVSSLSPIGGHIRKSSNVALGNELVIMKLENMDTLMAFESSASGVTVRDEVIVNIDSGSEASDRIFAIGGWAVCIDRVGWRAPGISSGVSLHAGSGASLVMLHGNSPAKHVFKIDRPPASFTIVQLAIDKMEFQTGDWPYSMVPLSIDGAGLTSGPVLCSEEQRFALDGVPVELPFTCRTRQPHTAHAVLDIINGQIGCSITPAVPVTAPFDVELCAEWSSTRTCTKVQLLPSISISQNKVSLLNPPATFTIYGHPKALKQVKIVTTPGLKVDIEAKVDDIRVDVTSDLATCGVGFVDVKSRLTGQDIRVEVERDCDLACGTLLGAIFSLIKPYLPTLMTVVAIAIAYIYVQQRLQRKAPINFPMEPPQTVLPPESSPILNRSRRTWSRSPYSAPVYGDASLVTDTSFSPNSSIWSQPNINRVQSPDRYD